MDMIGLKYFVSAAQWLNFTKAADECCITQTAMSLHIAKVEKELGFKLFNRDKRSVSLTPGGKSFYAEAVTVLRRYDEGVHRSAAIAAGFGGVLKISFANYIECSNLPELVRIFRKRYPGIEVLVTKSETNGTMDDLERGINDLTVVFPYEALDHAGLSSVRIDTHTICALMRVDHRLAGRRRISLAELREEAVIISGRDGSPRLYHQVQEDWRRFSFIPKKVIEADSADSILFLVEAGFGVALMPSYIGRLRNDRITMVNLDEDQLSVDMSLVYCRENDNSSLKLFLSFLKENDGAIGVSTV